MKQRAITLLYHDVISGDDPDVSGFGGTNAAEYKISTDNFEAHLRAIKNSLRGQIYSGTALGDRNSGHPPVLLSFDDGGASAYENIAPMLESFGWRGYFFVTTDRIDTAAFIDRDQIRELHRRGHVIGSHSCSHPRKITDCSREQLLDEWGRSLSVLAEIIGEPVTVASIPGGFYSKEVVETACQSGVQTLFTSEPVQGIEKVAGCDVVGRFSVKRGMGPEVPAEFVAGNRTRRFRQYAYWNLKKAAKALGGPVYPWIRTHYLARK